ncbi:BNIP - RELATED [Salix purpurea]|uniref:BNIP - RELATED n=1 Tax=Salix purpurea TaxID=77065 RepID=A0A9Q1AH04_SALPP|nr:BNIP - RELATED [Salix purpurea]
MSPSTSDNGDLRGISFSDIPGKFKDLPVRDSVSDILEPFAQTTLGTSSKIPRSTSFEFQSSQSDISFDLGGSNHSVKESSPDTFETTGEHQAVLKDDVSAGVPGKFLHAVSDVGSIASTIMYALYLNETIKSDQLFFSCILQDCSCCSLIAEKFFLTSPELLAGQGFSRLLLAGILMDTGYLTSPHCTTKDKYMARIQYEISVLMNDQIKSFFFGSSIRMR